MAANAVLDQLARPPLLDAWVFGPQPRRRLVQAPIRPGPARFELTRPLDAGSPA